ncbi:MAG: DUF2889 domain-containing protein [Actinobacteria bacterium]|jgi:hypothetical protein|nr:DUF2889 domain-containing protein [Actinomycetota bacterium]NBO79909.1 DUF2889 domain-containing protein [Actinomycetota bacterium]NBR76457.1 DUF2889 domain-containing protein [Actinomycetota bacterium]NBY58265.1 DUF2889 domain-containing protein [Actinomycetota bacterium]NDC46552.1 DUF2889 domain-containing protein [Actinomycetota bacterium]
MSKLEMFPADPEYIRIHTRRYEVRAFHKSDDCLMLRGVVVDEKPVGLYIEHDPDPLWMHHMILDLEIHFPSLVIQKANVKFNEHPHTGCIGIVDHYKKLEGMSITRGFTGKVKELFAGPRGCTHTTALLQAMAPVAVQSMWSMRVASARARGISLESMGDGPQTASPVNTCHMWEESGDLATAVREGREIEIPLSISKRLRSLGLTDDVWRE